MVLHRESEREKYNYILSTIFAVLKSGSNLFKQWRTTHFLQVDVGLAILVSG
jgi:hypothetical protein